MKKNKKIELCWFGAKCIFYFDELKTFEERIIVLRARDFDHAIELAEDNALIYENKDNRCTYTGFVDVFKMYEDELKEASEVYSIMRKSTLNRDDFIDKYYDDGSQCTQLWEDE